MPKKLHEFTKITSIATGQLFILADPNTGLPTPATKATVIDQLGITGGNTKVVLTDAATIAWDFSAGNVAEVSLTSTRNISITNITGIKYGTLRVKHSVARTQIILPGNTSGVGWSPTVYNATTLTGFTDLGFYYDGTNYTWYSNIPSTVALDTVAPSLVSAVVDPTNYARIILTYNETLSSVAGFTTSDFTGTDSNTGAHTTTSVDVSGTKIFVLTSAAFSSTGTITLTGGAGKIKDIAGNVAGNLTSQAIAQTVLAGTSGLPPTNSASRSGGVATLEVLNYNAATKVTAAGTVSSLKFNLFLVPSGVSFYITVWRKNGSTYDLVGKQTYAATDLVVGTNTLAVTTPFSVAVGDFVGFGYTSGGATPFIPATAGASGDEKYSVTTITSTTAVDWDAKTSAAAYSTIQLLT